MQRRERNGRFRRQIRPKGGQEMSQSYTVTALAFVAIGALAWSSSSGALPTAARNGVACEIRSLGVPGGVRLTALAIADLAARGSYQFTVTKTGAAGSSKIAQGGDFALEPGKQVALGEVALSLDAAGAYVAILILRRPDGETLCHGSYPRDL
jgi:hypothetical protein